MILRGIVFVVAALLVSLGVIAFAQFQSKSRSPRLTSEDVAAGKPGSGIVPSKPASGGGASEYTGGPIRWQYSMTNAKREAKANGGVIIVDIYTDWCGWCKRMDKDIYESPTVAALSRKDVFLKYNAEDGGEGQSFARKMNVRGYPTTFILDSDGNLLQTARGYVGSPQKFVSIVEGARAEN